MRYLLLTYYKKPDGRIDESMQLSNRVRTRDWQTVNVILDFKDQTVLKCSMGGVVVPRNWDRVVSYYYQHYSSTIERLFSENGHALNIIVDSSAKDA
jgi:hypothetical protein